MTTHITDLPHQHPDAVMLIGLIADAGFETRFVGGCVRDALLGRAVGDIDMATAALPEQVIAILSAAHIHTIPTGLAHGTVTAIINKTPFEITTLRKDMQTDGRHADVSFTDDWQEDAARRDFTVNALSADRDGRIYDYFDGLFDLEAQCLRFIRDPEARIHEDYLRLLRLFRFASVLGWSLNDENILRICHDLAPHLTRLSRERIQAELYKLLLGLDALPVAELLETYGILRGFCSSLDVVALHHVIEREAVFSAADPFRRLVACVPLDALDKMAVLTREQKKRLAHIISCKDGAFADWTPRMMHYFYGGQALLDCFALADMPWKPAELHKLFNMARDDMPVFPVSSQELITLCGGAGPLVGKIQKALELHWAKHDFALSREALLQKAAELKETFQS